MITNKPKLKILLERLVDQNCTFRVEYVFVSATWQWDVTIQNCDEPKKLIDFITSAGIAVRYQHGEWSFYAN